jgi:predicted RecA/RadA family phage recombinase
MLWLEALRLVLVAKALQVAVLASSARVPVVGAKEAQAKVPKAAMQFWAAAVVVALAQQTTQADQTQAEKAATASPS